MTSDTGKKAAVKQNTKVLRVKKQRRRQWLTFMRVIRYGVNNFTRNTWLTIAATAVMTVTLVSIFITVAAQDILQRTVANVTDNVTMSIYLKTDTTEDQVASVIGQLRDIKDVKSVSFISTEQARQQVIDQNKGDSSYIQAIGIATNELPATIGVTVKDLNNTKALDQFVETNDDLKSYINPQHPPTNLGKKKTAIDTIGSWLGAAQKIGWVASAVFTVLSVLVIFNTIRMAIFSRKEEIQMMKLIGASRSFIRGPFIVEATVYGFIGAVVATGVGYAILLLARDKIGSVINIASTAHLAAEYIGILLVGMIILGAIIGVFSSLLATRRYLKI